MSKGFKLNISGHEYKVETFFVHPQNTKYEGLSNTMTLEVQIYEDGKHIKLDKNSYAMEKIRDFICNSLNGQDAVYWDPEGKNRFETDNEGIN